MMAGAKNMHSSSGCAVIRRTFPIPIVNDLFPLVHLARETNRIARRQIARLALHSKRAIRSDCVPRTVDRRQNVADCTNKVGNSSLAHSL